MIKFLTNEEVVVIYRKLIDFHGKNIELPIKFLYYLQRNVVTLEPIYNSIIKTFKDLENKYGDIKDERFKAEYEEFIHIKNDIKIMTCNISELGDVKLSWQDLQSIDFMID